MRFALLLHWQVIKIVILSEKISLVLSREIIIASICETITK